MPANLPSIPSLAFHGDGVRAAEQTVYRATHEGLPVTVRVLESEDEALRTRLRSEAADLALLKSPAFVVLHEVGEAGGKPYIVTEQLDGEPLGERLSRGPLPEREVLALGEALAAALSELHAQGRVHGNLSPASVLLLKDGRAKLVDLMLGLFPGAPPSEERFRSPERAGRLQAPVDGRSDLYSLGAVLLQCATGEGPPAKDTRLGAVLERLLCERPEARYQTGAQLRRALFRLSDPDATASPPPPVGTELGRPRPVHALRGRNWELAELRASWVAARGGHGKGVLIEGAPGSGKSRLVEELLVTVDRDAPLVLSAKCSPEDATPLGALRAAFEAYLHLAEAAPAWLSSELQTHLQQAAQKAGPVLARFSPRWAALNGAPASGAVEEEGDFECLADFFCELARLRGRAVLFLDDVQWLDEASQAVLARVYERLGAVPLLILLTGRADASSAAALEGLKARLRPAGLRCMDLPLLDGASIELLMRDRLGGGEVDPAFIRRANAYSAGNPFAAAQCVRAMLAAGFLRPSWGRWRLVTGGRQGPELPAHVLSLVLQRIDALPASARLTLGMAALLGSPFSLGPLLSLRATDRAEVDADVAAATAACLIERVGEGRYAFVHDQIQEAVLLQLAPDVRRSLHQQLAEQLSEVSDASSAHLFAVARHLGLGEVASNWKRVHQMNLAAAARALSEHAHQRALAFLETAHGALPPGEEPDPEYWRVLGEARMRRGELAQAVAHFETALARTTDPWRRVILRTRIAKAHCATFETLKAWPQVEAALKEVGRSLPRGPLTRALSLLWSWLVGTLAWRLPFLRGRASDAAPRLNALLQLYDVGALVAYFQVEAVRYAELSVRSLLPASRASPSRASARALGTHGAVLAVTPFRRAAHRYLSLGMQMAEGLGDSPAIARNRLYQALSEGFMGRALEERRLELELEPLTRWLDPGDFIAHHGAIILNLHFRGLDAQAQGSLELVRKMARQTLTAGADGEGHPSLSMQLFLFAVLGRADEVRDYLARLPQWVHHSAYARGVTQGNLLGYLLEEGELGAPFDAAVSGVEALRIPLPVVPYHSKNFHLYRAYGELERTLAGQGSGLGGLRRAVKELCAVGTVPVLRCHALGLKASLRRLEGKRGRVEPLLARAEAVAHQVESPWALYAVARERARLQRDRGDGGGARAQLEAAHALARTHGWVRRLERVEAQLRQG